MKDTGRSVTRTRQFVTQRAQKAQRGEAAKSGPKSRSEREPSGAEAPLGAAQRAAFIDLPDASRPVSAGAEGPGDRDTGAETNFGQGQFWCHYVQDRLRHFSEN